MRRIISVRMRRIPATRSRYCQGLAVRVDWGASYWAICAGRAEASGGLASTSRERTEKPEALSSRTFAHETGAGPVTYQAVCVLPATARRSIGNVPSPTIVRDEPPMIASMTTLPESDWVVRSLASVSDRLRVSPSEAFSVRAISSEITA